MLASTLREDDQISLVSSAASSEADHRGHRVISPTVFGGCLPSFGGHHDVVGDRRSRTKASNKPLGFCYRGE